MRQILPRIWQWSWFSPEKQLDFNGYVLQIGDHHVMVDPPPLSPAEIAQIRQLGDLDYIVVTNRDHQREAETYRQEFHCRVFVPEADAPEMTVEADKTYADGELLPGGIWVIQLHDQKSPGESALYLEQGGGILIVGDAVIGDPPGELRLLPPDKYRDLSKAKQGLQRLLKYEFTTLLVGDGACIWRNAKSVLQQLLHT